MGYLSVWNKMENVQLQENIEDQHIWKWTSNHMYSSRSAYQAFFIGSVKFSCDDQAWRAWAPLKYKFFVWLALNNRCWTVERLHRRGLPHHHLCVLCSQEEESINQLLIQCSFTRQIWYQALLWLRKQRLTPASGDNLCDWWLSLRSCLRSEEFRM